jgi:hypothetical protein
MPRSVVGLVAALGVVLSSLLAFVHGDLTPLVVIGSGTATGLAAYLALPSSKEKICPLTKLWGIKSDGSCDRPTPCPVARVLSSVAVGHPEGC